MAYTKYSLTPADNNAAPPNGAPEGMLPSAVNDTMRDMMSQIRDAGDGIRGGTYTMTAPVITGGSITGVALSGNTFTSPVISGGSINNTPIGASTANTGVFTTLGASGVATFSAGTVSLPAITTTGDTNTGIFFPAADTIAFTEGGVEAMRIDSSGRVGINTSSPTQTLDVNGIIKTNTGMYFGSQDNFLYESAVGTVTVAIDGTVTQYLGFVSKTDGPMIDAAGGQLLFGTGSTERMRITDGGEVYIAGTADQGAYNLQCNGTGVWGAGAYVNGSDKRIKNNITPLDSGLDVVVKLNPVTYKYKEDWSKDQSTQTGFIAQELLTALEGKNYVDGVVQQGGQYMSVAYQNIIPILTKAIQELKAELDIVKAELATLKA